MFILGIWFALKEYLIEGLRYDHDVGISVLVFGAMGYIKTFVEGRSFHNDDGDYDDDDEEMEDVGEEELIIFQKFVRLS